MINKNFCYGILLLLVLLKIIKYIYHLYFKQDNKCEIFTIFIDYISNLNIIDKVDFFINKQTILIFI